MKFLFDLFPVIVFVSAFKFSEAHQEAAHALVVQYMSSFISGGVTLVSQAPILLASMIAIIASVLQIAYLKLARRKVDGMLWMSLIIIGVFGSATIYFHDDTFIKWKPTILYWAFALVMLGSQLIFGKNLMREGMESQFKLPDQVWSAMSYAWMIFFSLLGALNLFMAFVVYKNDLSAWVSFKLFGFTSIFFVFIVVQTLFLMKHIKEEDA